jgi:hypothetical protein
MANLFYHVSQTLFFVLSAIFLAYLMYQNHQAIMEQGLKKHKH